MFFKYVIQICIVLILLDKIYLIGDLINVFSLLWNRGGVRLWKNDTDEKYFKILGSEYRN
jgi:hypothetical protein